MFICRTHRAARRAKMVPRRADLRFVLGLSPPDSPQRAYSVVEKAGTRLVLALEHSLAMLKGST